MAPVVARLASVSGAMEASAWSVNGEAGMVPCGFVFIPLQLKR